MPSSKLADARQHALLAGFDLFGVVDAVRFDVCQPREQRLSTLLPNCGAAIVVGSGGPARDESAAKAGVRRLAEWVRESRARVVVTEPGRAAVSFGRLADAAGLGTVSPVTGLLLHPDFGPWVRVHAALLIEGEPFGHVGEASISDEFQPCCRCHQPCLEPAHEPAVACPLGAEHQGGAELPTPLPAPVPMSRVTRIALSAMRFMPRFRFLRR